MDRVDDECEFCGGLFILVLTTHKYTVACPLASMSKRNIDEILDGDDDVDVGRVDRSKIARVSVDDDTCAGGGSGSGSGIYPYNDEAVCPRGNVTLSQFLKIEYMRIRDNYAQDGVKPEHAFPITLKKERYVVLAIMTPRNGVDTHMIYPYFFDAGNQRVFRAKGRFDGRNGDAGDTCAGPLTYVISSIMSIEGQIARGDEKVVKSLQSGGTGLDGLEECPAAPSAPEMDTTEDGVPGPNAPTDCEGTEV